MNLLAIAGQGHGAAMTACRSKAELNQGNILGDASTAIGQKQPLARLEKPRREWQNL